MKQTKILFVLALIAAMFTSCGGDDDNGGGGGDAFTWLGNWTNEDYQKYKEEHGKYTPMEGMWQAETKDGKPYDGFLVYYFTDFIGLEIATEEPIEGLEPEFKNSSTIVINDKQFRYKNSVYLYTLNSANTQLTIRSKEETYVFKPYINKAWKWDGDWNSPNHPKYKEYQGKYNPIEGRWKHTHSDGKPILGKDVIYYHFAENRGWYEAKTLDIEKLLGYYVINGTGLSFDTTYGAVFKYEIKGDTLTLQKIPMHLNTIEKYVKIEYTPIKK